jgi:hypothetical protein
MSIAPAPSFSSIPAMSPATETCPPGDSTAAHTHPLCIHLGEIAHRLGLPPVPALFFEDLAFLLPSSCFSSAPRQNTLAPGSMPLEISFAEGEPTSLRINFEPHAGTCSPADRLAESAATAVHWAESAFDPPIAAAFRTESVALTESPCVMPRSFGAYLGATFDPLGLASVKLYAEWHEGLPPAVPAALQSVARTVLATVPGLVPHFLSLACERVTPIWRLYFLGREELPLSLLAEAFVAAGLLHRLPELAARVASMAGSSVILPAGATVLSFRTHGTALEAKIELLAQALPLSSSAFTGAVLRSLRERPATLESFRAWSLAAEIREWQGLHVAGFRVGPSGPARFGAYFRSLEF